MIRETARMPAQPVPKMESDGPRWYVVHTQPGAESRAVVNLERQGYRTFCPRYRKTIHHARRRTTVLTPVFPCYLFVALDTSRDPWHSINGTRGVVRLLTHGDIPCPVPRGVIEALRCRVGSCGVMDLSPTLHIGQAVMVTEGPFENLVGHLARLDGAGRVCVLLNVLGRAVTVTMRAEGLSSVA